MVITLAVALATPFLHRPFEGERRFSGVFDHGDPSRENDFRQLTTWGTWTWGRRGHAAYDWPMPVGTPVLAAADGVVHVAGDAGPTRCGAEQVDQNVRIGLRHRVGSERYATWYLHLSKVAVKPNQVVEAGDVIGWSGNTGCSSGPHLHFAVQQRTPDGIVHVDPYGWTGSGPDPLQGRRVARWLWLDGEAPLLYKQGGTRKPPRGDVGFGAVRPVAWKDDVHPNQEWLELKLRPGARAQRLAGWSIHGRNGTWPLPDNAKVRPGRNYRLYSGEGRSGRRYGYLNATSDLYEDDADCPMLLDPSGEPVHMVLVGRAQESPCRRMLRELEKRRGIR